MTFSRSRLLGLLLALAAAGLVLALWPRRPPDPKELIVRNVVKMTHAAETRQVSGVMSYVSERFRSEDGWTRAEAKAVVAREVLTGTWVRIFTTDLEVTLTSATTAELSGKFIFGRSDADKLEELAKESVLSAYRIDGRLEKEADGEWRFVWARPRQLPPEGLF